MLWEPHQTAFTTWQLASGKTESTTITRQRWIQHLARTYPSETALTVTEDQVTQWLANPRWQPATRKSALQSIRQFFRYLTLTGTRDDNPTRLIPSILFIMVFLNSHTGYIFRALFVVTKDTAKYSAGKYTAAEGFLLFLIFLLLIFGVLVLRGVGLMRIARIGKSQMGFNSAMAIVGTAVLPQIPAFLVLFFLSFLLPQTSSLSDDVYAASQRPILVMMIVFAVFSVIVGESLLYLGQAKVANTEKSVFFMYVVLSTAFVLAGILVLYFGFSVLAPSPSH